MKIKKENKVSIILIALVIITIGVSYALWIITKEQTGENVVSTSCLDIELTNEKDSISLTNTFPITDVEGKALKPYKFTVHNKCDNYVDYTINLEMLNETTLSSENIKMLLNKEDQKVEPKLLSEYIQNDSSKINNAKESKLIYIDKLKPSEAINFELRLWLKEELTKESGIENQIFRSKIVVEGKLGEETAVNYIENLANNNSVDLAYDGTRDNNLRYIGSNPNNYVKFNCNEYGEECEIWRIIGVMNNIIDDKGYSKSLLKLIRKDSIGNYSWDSSNEYVNAGWGVNEWSKSDIETVLNNDYLYRENMGNICYTAALNEEKECPIWEEIGIKNSSLNMISKVRWNTGTYAIDDNKLWTSTSLYDVERSLNNGRSLCDISSSHCNDDVVRMTSWDGYVGLMYPSDYGFSISNKDCLNLSMFTFSNGVCPTSSWLTMDLLQYTITPMSVKNYATGVFYIGVDGHLDYYGLAGVAGEIRPTVYLKDNIKISKNLNSLETYGSIDNPFVLEYTNN